MPSAGFEPAVPAIKQLKIYALDNSAIGIGIGRLIPPFHCILHEYVLEANGKKKTFAHFM
jgi:hypothetical protein